MITIGIDPHKSSLTAVAVDPAGQTHPPIRTVVDTTTPAVVLAWAARRAAVTASGTTLTDIQGIGFLTAAKILALTGDIRRFPNQEHYASYAGTAPIDVSSGDNETHRLSRRGNRQLNVAIHVAAVTQARDPGPGRDHYRRKIAEHKTAKEARRSLKRRISNAVYRRILADHQRLQLRAA